MFNTVGLAAMFLVPHASLVAPPAPVAIVTPAPVAVTPAPVAITPMPVVPTSPAPTPVPMAAPPAPTVTTSVECVVTITDPYGNAMTESPGMADASGSCAAYSTGWPASDTVTVTPQATTVTAGGGGL